MVVWTLISDNKDKLFDFVDKLVTQHRGILKSFDVSNIYLYYPNSEWDEFIKYKALLKSSGVTLIECNNSRESLDRIYKWSEACSNTVVVVSGSPSDTKEIYDRYVYHRKNLSMWKIDFKDNSLNYQIIGPDTILQTVI